MAEEKIKTESLTAEGVVKAVKAPKKTSTASADDSVKVETVKKTAAKKTVVKDETEAAVKKVAAPKAETTKKEAAKEEKAVKKPAEAKEEKAAVKTAVEKTEAAKPVIKDKLIKVTLVKSTLGSKKGQIATVEALGLKKIRQSNIIKDNAASRGMIFKVKHLVSISEVI